MNTTTTPTNRLAAVLMLVRPLVIDGKTEPHLVFIRRSQKVAQHKGQISFPGGGYRPSQDGQPENAALRETHEELGLHPDTLQILGGLPEVDTFATGFTIYPFVAVPKDPSASITYVPDDFEVAKVLEIPLRHLINPQTWHRETWVFSGQPRPVIFYNYQHTVIWGATAFILTDFIDEISKGKWSILLS